MTRTAVTFDEYYDIVVKELKKLDPESRLPDKDTVREDYRTGVSVEDSAKAFYDEWKD